MMNPYYSRLRRNRILSQSLVVGTLTAIGLLSGFIPGLSKDSPTLVFSAPAYAQAVSADEVTKYAQAVLAIEQIRQAAYREIKIIIGSDVPEIVCNRPATIRKLPSEAQGLAQNYCNQSSAIVANYFPRGKNARFNEITTLMQGNANLRTKIQNELVRLQQ
ncbi:MAG TPA: DUF4168 domain-containing protein [Coleofasciculaceae cyanobacterium]